MRKNASNGLTVRFSEALKQLGISQIQNSAIAVSGGGDSLALMHLVAEWAAARKTDLPTVLTVDHGLRRDSGADALKVKAWAGQMGLTSYVLAWSGAKPATGIEEKARTARYRLMGKWCAEHGISWLFLGHTRDDEAENFLLRLGRGSGVDGLAAMNAAAPVPVPVPGVKSVKLLRPLLDFSRSELRDYLNARSIPWIEDPMNDDGKFARNRVRKLLPVLAEAGIPASRIVAAGRHLARARTALDDATQDFLARHAEFGVDTALVNADALRKLPREIGLRALSEALRKVAGREYRPRFSRLERLFDAAISPDFRGQTLAGCCVENRSKAATAFGAQCLSIRPEPPRKASARPAPKGPDPGEELPGIKLP